MSRNKIKINGYMSLSKLAWNRACKKLNEIESARNSFRLMVNCIEYSSDMTDKDKELYEAAFCKCFNVSFIGTVLSGRYMTSSFKDCKLGFDMIRKITRYYAITCHQMKYQCRITNMRWN